jgi:catechol 2,3-dioxygenase-like lactoylglutathione lyase family enzyme
MRQHVTGIDHCLILVRSLDAARDAYQRLGFTLSPRGFHPADHGTANHTIMLGRDYLELLGVIADVPGSQRWRETVAAREGAAALALMTDDADAAGAEMRATGIELSPPQRWARPVDLPNGTKSEAVFRTTKFPDDMIAGFRLFCCQHLTRETVWLPELTSHANTAYAIDHVTAVTASPANDAAVVGKVFAAPAKQEAPGLVGIDTGSGLLRFATPAALETRYRGADLTGLNASGLVVLALKIRSPGAAEAALAKAGIAFRRTEAGIAVAPKEACGVLLILRESE